MLLLGELSVDSSKSCPVAVKLLKDKSPLETRRDFCHEVKVMASFDHENILRFIGIARMGTSLMFIVKVSTDNILFAITDRLLSIN